MSSASKRQKVRRSRRDTTSKAAPSSAKAGMCRGSIKRRSANWIA